MKLVSENSIEADLVDGRVEIYEKLRENQVIKTHWIKKEYHAYHFGSKILNEILGTKKFDFPKSLFLMRDIFKLISPRKATILDFFAGSGTTGHAVMKLNAEDGGSRKFILCTNNENNICRDVTYERIKRVIARMITKQALNTSKLTICLSPISYITSMQTNCFCISANSWNLKTVSILTAMQKLQSF